MLDDIERRLARLEWAAQFPPEPVHAGRLLIAFCIGIVATLAWQSYGGAAREMIANSSPRLSWLAPSAVSAGRVPTGALMVALGPAAPRVHRLGG
jgi:hypothetical protein